MSEATLTQPATDASASPNGLVAVAQRYASRIKWASAALILISLMLLFRALPTEDLIAQLKTWLDSLGFWGPIAFALIYIVAVIVMAPGSLLTLAAGTVFGLWTGTVVVVVAANTGAALAFLIARYVARDAVAKKIESRPKFKAIDRAISEGGWKVVAMLRLSPAVPFNVQNYMYGLTGVKFLTAVLTSLVAMLPGTFLYVYLGYVGGAALGGDRQKSPAEWVVLAVGLLATIGVTVYVTKLAKKKLEEQTDIDGAEDQPESATDEPQTPKGMPWGALATTVVALVLVSAAAVATLKPAVIYKLIGVPPRVALAESYMPKPYGPKVDHALFDAVLKEHVDEHGWVDYAALKQDPAKLDAYIDQVGKVDFEALGRNQKLALLINAYNAFTLKLIIDNYPVDTIRTIDGRKPWHTRRWQVGDHQWTLHEIEHDQIRPHFYEPRIHFAVVCAAIGCPPLRNEAYSADRIEQQLAEQTAYVHDPAKQRWYKLVSADDDGRSTLHLTQLYKWYGHDFKQVAGSVLRYVAAQRPSDELNQLLKDGKTVPRVEYLEYDWTLNDVKNRP